MRTGQYILKPILVTNGRIVEVRTRPDGMIRPPPPTTHIELGDMTLLPGLIDMHVHLGSDPTYGGYSRLRFGDRFWSVLQVAHAQRTLAAGFTTVRSVGSKDWNEVGLR